MLFIKTETEYYYDQIKLTLLLPIRVRNPLVVVMMRKEEDSSELEEVIAMSGRSLKLIYLLGWD